MSVKIEKSIGLRPPENKNAFYEKRRNFLKQTLLTGLMFVLPNVLKSKDTYISEEELDPWKITNVVVKIKFPEKDNWEVLLEDKVKYTIKLIYTDLDAPPVFYFIILFNNDKLEMQGITNGTGKIRNWIVTNDNVYIPQKSLVEIAKNDSEYIISITENNTSVKIILKKKNDNIVCLK